MGESLIVFFGLLSGCSDRLIGIKGVNSANREKNTDAIEHPVSTAISFM
jgi:hypothetical protein